MNMLSVRSSSSLVIAGTILFIVFCGYVPKTSGAGVPAGYTLVAGTDIGKKLVVHKKRILTLPEAIKATVVDLTRVFDARPTITHAFADTKTRGRGGASFTGELRGQPVKGFIFCTVGGNGADIMVIYCRADAPDSTWEKLDDTPTPRVNGNNVKSVISNVALETYTFPDGTGTIGLPAGWKTDAQSVIHGVLVKGPANQTIILGMSYSVNTPNSFIVQNQIQMIQNARRMGFPPPQPIEMLVAPYTGPVEAMKNLIPQLSLISLHHGGPATVLTKFLEKPKSVPSEIPNGQAASVYFSFMRTTSGTSIPYRSRALIETWPIGPGVWSLYVDYQLAAPDVTFDRDMPVMVAIATSVKTDPRAVQQATNRAIDAGNRFTQATLAANAKRQAAFNDYLHSVQRNSTIQSRAVDNWDEVIRGTRTVEDTQTGERVSVDLGHVDDIVDSLNRSDPGRYIQIPLRDEMDPLPGK